MSFPSFESNRIEHPIDLAAHIIIIHSYRLRPWPYHWRRWILVHWIIDFRNGESYNRMARSGTFVGDLGPYVLPVRCTSCHVLYFRWWLIGDANGFLDSAFVIIHCYFHHYMIHFSRFRFHCIIICVSFRPLYKLPSVE